MPSGKNWFRFIFVNIAFIIIIVLVYYYASIKNIKDNWAMYRCNPLFMPLSNDIESEFVHCVQNIQTNAMGYFLQPITYLLSNLSDLAGTSLGAIDFGKAMFDKIRTLAIKSFGVIFGVFLNIVIEMQKIMIGTKDTIGKLIGVIVTILFEIDGAMKTAQSSWNGIPGQALRKVGSCFLPSTLVRLQNDEIIEMQHLHLGDVLEGGVIVNAIIQTKNTTEETLYCLPKRGVQNADIYVTGSHLVKDESGEFVEIRKYSRAISQDTIQPEWFSCLITSDHTIPIGKEIFWDWEDHWIKIYNTI